MEGEVLSLKKEQAQLGSLALGRFFLLRCPESFLDQEENQREIHQVWISALPEYAACEVLLSCFFQELLENPGSLVEDLSMG